MNSLEMDLRRAITSKGFVAGFILELLVLFQSGFDSELFRVCVPIIAALPYSTAWLIEYQYGYIKAYLHRTGVMPYIVGKFLSCSISGGLVEALGCLLFQALKKDETEINLILIFTSGMLWAAVAMVLAAWSKSRYIAYGSGFVLYYLLVMLHERYFEAWYCLSPYEWINPKHTWIFGEQSILLLLFGLILLLFCFYYELLRRCLERV